MNQASNNMHMVWYFNQVPFALEDCVFFQTLPSEAWNGNIHKLIMLIVANERHIDCT